MAFQPVPNTVSAEVRYDVLGKAIENVLHFKFDGAYGITDLEDLAEAIDMWVGTDWMPLMPNNVTFREVFVRGLNSETDLFTTAAGNVGDIGGMNNGNPNNCSKAIKLGTSLTGRNARGRLFVAGVPQSVLISDNYVTQAWVDDLIEAIEALIAICEALGWTLAIVSRFLNGVKRAIGVVYPVTTVTVTNLTTDSMRGRMV
jgi:hypothetical protein